MADVITRFKLETTQFDSKLRDTSKALKDIAHQAVLGGKDFDKFSDEAIKSARALGTVQSGATNTKDKLRDLVGSYNDAAKAYNSLTDTAKKGEFGKAMSQSLTQLQQRIKETKEELYSLGDGMKGGGGGLGGKFTDMLSVAGGNLLAQGVTKLAGELKDMVVQGVELARAGEGVRIAFERLGRGDLLDGLRQATHGTVTDLELMKAAVKFNDFKLPLEELGTMLAFAQQKAKDTGQSVDYMVDSIVTGLGRKSLMILDNLGLSAAEIKDKMKDTGDMTKAVGEIIREQMAKAGDYVETAADRATKANVELENAMTRLGETFQPLTDAANDMWTSIKVGALDLISSAVQPLINKLTEAGRLRAQLNNINAGTGTNQTRAGKDLNYLKYEISKYGANDSRITDLYNRQRGRYIDQENQAWRQAQSAYQRYENLRKNGGSQADLNAYYQRWQTMEAKAKAWGNILKEYDDGYKKLTTAAKVDIKTDEAEQNITSLTQKLKELQEQRKKAIAAGDTDLSKSLQKEINQVKNDIKGLGGSVTTRTSTGKTLEEKIAWDPNKTNLAATKAIDTMPSVWAMMGGEEGLRKMMGIDKKQFDIGRVLKEYVSDPDKNKRNKQERDDDRRQEAIYGNISRIAGSVQGMFSTLEQMGIEIPDELKSMVSGVQSIMEFMSAMMALVSTIAGTSVIKSLPIIGTFAHNGAVIHAAGGAVTGNTYSGDQIPAMLNAGEVVLNRSQVGMLASALSSERGGGQNAQPFVTGDIIFLGLQNYLQENGYGKLMTTNMR